MDYQVVAKYEYENGKLYLVPKCTDNTLKSAIKISNKMTRLLAGTHNVYYTQRTSTEVSNKLGYDCEIYPILGDWTLVCMDEQGQTKDVLELKVGNKEVVRVYSTGEMLICPHNTFPSEECPF